MTGKRTVGFDFDAGIDFAFDGPVEELDEPRPGCQHLVIGDMRNEANEPIARICEDCGAYQHALGDCRSPRCPRVHQNGVAADPGYQLLLVDGEYCSETCKRSHRRALGAERRAREEGFSLAQLELPGTKS